MHRVKKKCLASPYCSHNCHKPCILWNCLLLASLPSKEKTRTVADSKSPQGRGKPVIQHTWQAAFSPQCFAFSFHFCHLQVTKWMHCPSQSERSHLYWRLHGAWWYSRVLTGRLWKGLLKMEHNGVSTWNLHWRAFPFFGPTAHKKGLVLNWQAFFHLSLCFTHKEILMSKDGRWW